MELIFAHAYSCAVMKYHKNRANYDAKSGRVAPNFANAAVSKQTAFVPLAQEGSLKRNRPSDFEWPEPTQRPPRARARRRSHAEGGDEGDEDEDEIMDDILPHQPFPQSPSSGTELLMKHSIYQATESNGLTSSPAPVAAASWMTPFTPDDKAAALTWAVSRPQPADFLDNLKSWIEFAETVSTYSMCRLIFINLMCSSAPVPHRARVGVPLSQSLSYISVC